MSCVSKSSFSVRINDKTYGNIISTRRLRQGDPLSPYLFLLCVEGFIALLSRAKEEERLHGVSICRRAPRITHLLFADDSLLFCRLIKRKSNALLIQFNCMQHHLGNVSILKNHLFILAAIQRWYKEKVLKQL